MRRGIPLRKSENYSEAIVYGDFIPALDEYDNVISFYRKGKDKNLMVIINYQNKKQMIDFEEKYKMLINNYGYVEIDNNKLMLEPYQGIVVEIL